MTFKRLFLVTLMLLCCHRNMQCVEQWIDSKTIFILSSAAAAGSTGVAMVSAKLMRAFFSVNSSKTILNVASHYVLGPCAAVTFLGSSIVALGSFSVAIASFFGMIGESNWMRERGYRRWQNSMGVQAHIAL